MLIPNIFPTNFISIVMILSAKYVKILEKDERTHQKNMYYFEIIGNLKLAKIQFAGKTNQMDFVVLNLIAFSASEKS